MLEIGRKIKALREERKLTGKDLAGRIGLSQSQMSRLEQGQRRIDAEILAKIASALGVSPGDFFDGEIEPGEAPKLSLKREKELSLATLHAELGKVVRSERRKRHLTADDLARKTGQTRAYVQAFEEGRRVGVDDGFLKKALRLLAIDPLRVVEIQERIIQDLKARVNQLDLSLSMAKGGADLDDSDSWGTPILVGDETPYPAELDARGVPVAAVEGFLSLPELVGRPAFAIRIVDDSMSGRAGADGGSFEPGDIAVFSTERAARSGEYAYARLAAQQAFFRQLFHDEGPVVRLHALSVECAPIIVDPSELDVAWPLIAHVRRADAD